MFKQIKLPDGNSIAVNLPDDVKQDPSMESMQTLLDGFSLDGESRIAIEFECGNCCKKVLNGAKIIIIFDFVILLPRHRETLLLKVFSDGKVVDKQIMSSIIIPFDKICSFEFGAIEIDP